MRDIPRLDTGRLEILSGDGMGTSRSRSPPYKEVGRLLRETVDASGEVGTDVCDVVIERAEFSEETEDPVELGLMLSKVFDRRMREDGE